MCSIDDLLAEYDAKLSLHTAFRQRAENLVGHLLSHHHLPVHYIAGRVKERDRLKQKVTRSTSRYTSLADVTDIVGLRVVTYYEDDVDRIARVIEDEFAVDRENSVDKGKLLDPDRFGYRSVHYVLSLSLQRLALPEYREFLGCKFELQIRTILQHAWAEMEHDLGYKSAVTIPHELRRRFSRLAGLLELADLEFIQIRDRLAAYKKEISNLVLQTPADISINRLSVAAYVGTSSAVKDLDIALAESCDARLELDETIFDTLAAQLLDASLDTLGELDGLLAQHADFILKLGEHTLREEAPEVLPIGISLLYVSYARIAARDGAHGIVHFLERWHFCRTAEERLSFANDAVRVLQQVQGETGSEALSTPAP